MNVFVPQERNPGASIAAGGPASVRAERPPTAYWRRWCEDAPPPIAVVNEPEPAPVVEASSEAALFAAVEAALEEPAPKVVPGQQNEPAYRVLIVEDDRSQALFAQSVLRNAGIEAQAVAMAGETMAAIDSFHPDLVLMDLHMPGMSGTELLGQIRGHAAHAHMPVVFLTGDSDPERHVEALDSGGDDYLRKPVRPRHLIAAVQNRIRRARALKRQQDQDVRKHPATGLLTRTFMLKQLGLAFPKQIEGAIHFILIEGTTALRDRYGYAALDTLLTDAGKLIAAQAGELAATRLNDNTFLIYSPALPADAHADWARKLRDAFSMQQFNANGEALRLRACIGYVDLAYSFADAGAALAAAEEALRQARNEPIAIAGYRPPREATNAETAALLMELQEALQLNRLELAFQPIVSVVGGDEVQYQTLMRMRGDNGRMRTAAEVMPIAERAGLMHEIDRRIMALAVSILHDRQRSGRPARLFVPQAPRTLGQEGYGQWLLDALSSGGIQGAQLVVDVRLGDALVYAVSLREFCQRMVGAGVRLCLSQFQSNPEADALLAQLPLNYVRLSPYYSGKIEQPGVQDEMRLVIDRAHKLGLQVIGQHVENPQTAATLWLSGIDYLQGDLVQRAANVMDFDFQHSLL
jgi:PleD family two-component response regulator/EAL domain-containing protein (putative c-di-GMP-specific phosphodiesterase class I)